MAPLHTFTEAESREERSQIIKANVGVCPTLQHLQENLLGHSPIMQPFDVALRIYSYNALCFLVQLQVLESIGFL